MSYATETHSWECDFVTPSEAIQVCWELTPENRERELTGVLRAAALPGRRRPLILTLTSAIGFEWTAWRSTSGRPGSGWRPKYDTYRIDMYDDHRT